VDAITGKMGSDILLLDLRDVTLIADYFVIATTESDRQLNAIVSDMRQQFKETYGVSPISVEGAADSGWVLMDYGSVVVHLFSSRQREYYQLEELWSSARTVVRIA
jgi:ribosome-associated protein